VDQTERFKSWDPVYKHFYLHPNYGGVENLPKGGVENLPKGQLTHLHHPPFSTLIFLLTGIFIFQTGSPPLTLFLFFCIYLLEVCSIIWIGIPRAERKPALILTIWFFCSVSYPALVTFGRANYVNAGLTTLPIVAFLIAVFAWKQATLPALFALAIAVNIHPNAIIFLFALPLVLGIRKAIKPSIQFLAIAGVIFAVSYFAAHKLYPDYTIAVFLQGIAVYKKVYISEGLGILMGSSLYGLIRALIQGLQVRVPFLTGMRIFYVLAMSMAIFVSTAFWKSLVQNRTDDEYAGPQDRTAKDHIELGHEERRWPLPLAPFFLVSFYCIFSPIFGDYHLLVFLAPLILVYFELEHIKDRWQFLALVAFTSLFLLSPKNYFFQETSIQIILNPAILCGAVLWLAIELLNEKRQPVSAPATFQAADGR